MWTDESSSSIAYRLSSSYISLVLNESERRANMKNQLGEIFGKLETAIDVAMTDRHHDYLIMRTTTVKNHLFAAM